ncbi:MAG: hypothetical protein LDLANPLL_00316 [Turneriella sp.]|nr:hypothetical protein [Turneriella sp.]
MPVARILFLFFLFFLQNALAAAPIGWGDAILVEPKAEEYGVCCHEGEGQIYAVSTRLKTHFVKNASTVLEIVLSYTENGRFARYVVSEITLAPSTDLFPVYPSVSVLGNEILIAWQETSPSGNASGIYYLYSASGPTGFGTKRVLPSSAGKLNAILPLAKMVAPGQHVIFYQEPSAANRFMLSAAIGSRGVFTALTTVAQISGGVRGALFPNVLRQKNRLDILYQNRAAATLIDDIFRAFSIDNGKTWSGNLRITENGNQNFSGKITNTKEKLVFTWQSNPRKVWTIFAAPEGGEAVQVNDSDAPSFLPTIVASHDALVVAWQDMRGGTPQIYAKFLNRAENSNVGVDHRVTKEGISGKPLDFVRWGERPFLFYGCGPGLCVRETDTLAVPISISSKTHALGMVSKSSDAIFTWAKINDLSGIESYAWTLDDVKDTDPDLYNLNARATQITVPGLNGGAYFMHIKYRDLAGNVSPVTHYPFVVDSVPPSRPIIKSPTHESGIPDSRQNVVLQFSSSDDSGIQFYRYAFAEQLPRVFTETTEKGELTFSDVPFGSYFFAVEAVDLGGNTSERAFFKIEIGANERNDLTIRHNAEADVITRSDIAFTIQDMAKRGIREVYYQFGFDIKDPFAGKKATLENVDNIYTARISHLEKGISVISLGIVYTDGTHAPARHFYFDSNDPRARKKFEFIDVEYEKLPTVKPRKPFEVGGRAELISSAFDRGILEIRLNYDPTTICGIVRTQASKKPCEAAKKVKVKGYVWEIASADRIPQGEINFSGKVEFIYLQKPGTYFLNAKTIFRGPEREQFAYDSTRIEVPDLRKEFRKNVYYGVATLLVIFLLALLWQRKRIIFYAGAWA